MIDKLGIHKALRSPNVLPSPTINFAPPTILSTTSQLYTGMSVFLGIAWLFRKLLSIAEFNLSRCGC